MATERGGVGVNLILNSLILGNVASPQLASAYFLVASMAQLVISPWVPAADVTWLGYQGALTQIFRALAVATGLSTVVFLVLIFAVFPVTEDTYRVVLPCIFSNAAMIAVSLLVPLKYGSTRRYVIIAGSASVAAVAVKLLAAISGHQTLVAYSLFSDMILVGAFALLMGDRASLADESSSTTPREPTSVWLKRMSVAATAVLVSLVPARLLIVTSTSVLSSRDHVSLGIAMQLLNMVSLAGSALAGTVGGSIAAGGREGARIVGLGTLPFIFGVAVLYLVAVWALGPPILNVLYPDYSQSLVSQLLFGAGFVPAALVSAVAWSTAGVLRRLPIFIVGTAVYGIASVLAFTLVGDEVPYRMLGWGVGCLVGALVTLAVVLR